MKIAKTKIKNKEISSSKRKVKQLLGRRLCLDTKTFTVDRTSTFTTSMLTCWQWHVWLSFSHQAFLFSSQSHSWGCSFCTQPTSTCWPSSARSHQCMMRQWQKLLYRCSSSLPTFMPWWAHGSTQISRHSTMWSRRILPMTSWWKANTASASSFNKWHLVLSSLFTWSLDQCGWLSYGSSLDVAAAVAVKTSVVIKMKMKRRRSKSRSKKIRRKIPIMLKIKGGEIN